MTLETKTTAPGLVPRLETSAALRAEVRLDSLATGPAAPLVEDLGSYVEASLGLVSSGSARLVLRLFPLDGDRERVGWLEVLAWGGAVGPERESPYASARGPVRSATLAFETPGLELQVGLKTAAFLEPTPAGPPVEETSYGAFGRVELAPTRALGLGVAVGRFEHGRLSGPGRPPRATTTGASLRATVRGGAIEPEPPVAFGAGLEPDDPTAGLSVAPRGQSAWAASLEGVTLLERVRAFEDPASTLLLPARAAALVGTARLGAFEARAALVWRDAAFVTRSVPGVFPDLAPPRDARLASDRLALLGATLALRYGLVPGLSLGLRAPAAVMTHTLDTLGQPTGGTVVVYGAGDSALLPPGQAPVPIVEVRPSFGVALSHLLVGLAWLELRRDFNRTRLVAGPGGFTGRGFSDPNRLGYGVAVRAAW